MASNQRLSFHRVSPRRYDLTGLRTGSVRDQMLRAIALAEALATDAAEVTGNKGEGLLVLGGGVAGISCALAASQKGIQVIVLEKEIRAFLTLASANWRRLAPFEYDWPHETPTRPWFPSVLPFPLTYFEDPAATIAKVWEADFRDWLNHDNPGLGSPGHVEVLWDHDITQFPLADLSDAAGVVIAIEAVGPWNKMPPTTRQYGAVVRCAGFGTERTFDVAKPARWRFEGHGFWTTEDGLHQHDFGILPARTPMKSLLISGGGDGAMQDLQRAATADFGAKLLERLEGVLRLADPSKYYLPLMLADDRAKRAHAWRMANGLTKDLPNEMVRWNRVYQVVVDKMIDRYKSDNGFAHRNDAIDALSQALLKPAFLNGAGLTVSWILIDANPGFAYALNRLLSYFVVRMLQLHQTEPVLRTQHEIVKIVPASSGANCCGDPTKCHGNFHDVTLQRLSDKKELPEERYNVIIIRHGLVPHPDGQFGNGAPVPEQLVPYDVPD